VSTAIVVMRRTAPTPGTVDVAAGDAAAAALMDRAVAVARLREVPVG